MMRLCDVPIAATALRRFFLRANEVGKGDFRPETLTFANQSARCAALFLENDHSVVVSSGPLFTALPRRPRVIDVPPVFSIFFSFSWYLSPYKRRRPLILFALIGPPLTRAVEPSFPGPFSKRRDGGDLSLYLGRRVSEFLLFSSQNLLVLIPRLQPSQLDDFFPPTPP